MRCLASLPPRYTVRPEHIRSLASMPPRYTVRPEHKKGSQWLPFLHNYNTFKIKGCLVAQLQILARCEVESHPGCPEDRKLGR